MDKIEKLKKHDQLAKTASSLSEIAQKLKQERKPQTLLLICDVSGSMATRDCPGGRRRIDVLKEALCDFRDAVIVIFSSNAFLISSPDLLPEPGGTTNMAAAIREARLRAVGKRIVLLSDGEPDSESDALAEAQFLRQPISTIYCGPPGGPGEEFLRRLAQITGGKFGEIPPAESTRHALVEKIRGVLPSGN